MAYSKNTWVNDDPGGTVGAAGGQLNAARLQHLEDGVETAASTADTASTTASAAVPKSVVTTAGDLVYATGNAAVTRLALGAAGNVLKGGASAPSWGKVGAAEITAGSITRTELATVTRKAPCPMMRQTATGMAVAYPDAALQTVAFGFPVPDDYVSGDLTFKFAVFGPATSGNSVRFQWTTQRWRDVTAVSTIESAVTQDVANWTANTTVILSRTITAANFQAGDVMSVVVDRDGAHAADTYASSVLTLAAWVEYTGRA